MISTIKLMSSENFVRIPQIARVLTYFSSVEMIWNQMVSSSLSDL